MVCPEGIDRALCQARQPHNHQVGGYISFRSRLLGDVRWVVFRNFQELQVWVFLVSLKNCPNFIYFIFKKITFALN
jgi:hypothetical protein